MTANTHVIFGTGPAGTSLAELLHAQGKRVRCVSRSGRATLPAGVELAAADALDQGAVDAVCQDAAVIYHCANVPYPQQVELIPRFQTTITEGAARAGARLVVLDTLYVYGPTGGAPMTEQTPHRPTTRKGRMRAQLVERYLAAHHEGRVQVAIGRAADFYGPRVLNSVLGDRVFPAALAGGRMQLMGNIDLPHSYSYIGDVARGMAALGERAEALGRSWLLPVAPALTQRQVAGMVAAQLGSAPKVMATPRLLIQLLGLGDSFMREFVEMFYQYTEPQIVDSSAIERTLGLSATPLPQGIAATVEWYRQRAASAA